MEMLEDLIKSLELDRYPYRILIISGCITSIIAMVFGYFVFVK